MAGNLYGLDHSNKDFTDEESFGKNTFTTAFPVAMACYISEELGLPMNYIEAYDAGGHPDTRQVLEPLDSLIGCSPSDASWCFEDSFAGFDDYATNSANRSDIVVKEWRTGREVSALEVKLVVVPTSGTANKSREEQCCELVVRPPSIEQLCFSVAASFGKARTIELRDIIVKALGNPIDYEWSDQRFMRDRREAVLAAANDIIMAGLDVQRPFVLMGEWRTQGQKLKLDEECFDAFFWANLAFLQLFTRAMAREVEQGATSIGRPARALIWFVKSMFDYTAQGTVTFERTHSLITFGGQTDKAGSFTNNGIRPFVKSQNFVHPRVPASCATDIISPDGISMLKPERRLDGALTSL